MFPTSLAPEIRRFAKDHVKLRDGFPQFVSHCHAESIPLLVVSGGVDLVIEPVLEGWNLPIYCNTALLEEECIELAMPYTKTKTQCETCGTCAVCKIAIMERYPIEEGWYRIAIGDSISDFGMCTMADKVFARGILKAYLDEQGLAYTEFEDFFTVRNQLMALLAKGSKDIVND